MEPPSDRDRSSPERSKRRLSSQHSDAKSSRASLDHVGLASTHDQSKDSAAGSHLRQTPFCAASSPRDVAPLTMPHRTYPSASSSAASPVSSASDDTALADHRRPPSRRKRVSNNPAPSAAPRRVPDADLHPYQTSTSSSSSSSHLLGLVRLTDSGEDKARSPPPTLTLSTGQPISNPPLKTQAAFVGKLFSMLGDEEIRKTGLIHWSNGGSTFTCPNPTEFAKTVLPRFFKHNNWQSFVRQLNMYSFNKVNDLHATTSDPTAWEFRHPLFRQGEPHLLASIKRKTNRPSQADGPNPLSPSDDNGEFGRGPGAVAGWMQDDGHGVAITSSPLPQPPIPLPAGPPASRPEVYGYNLKTGETIQSRPYEASTRVSSKAYAADLARLHGLRATATPPAPPSAERPRVKRHHSDLDHAPPGSARSHRGSTSTGHRTHPSEPSGSVSSHWDSQQYPQPLIPSPSPIMALTNQVSFLEERIARLSETLSLERVDNVRSHMDMLSYVASITLWLPNAPSAEISALQDSLSRQQAELRHKYDALVAVDTLAHFSSGPGTDVDPRRQSDDVPMYSTHRPQTSMPAFAVPQVLPIPYPDQRLTSLHPSPLSSPHLIPRRHTGAVIPPSTSYASLVPQMPPGGPGGPTTLLPLPSPGERPSFDQPPFSRSPLMHRPASTSNLTALIESPRSQSHIITWPNLPEGMISPGVGVRSEDGRETEGKAGGSVRGETPKPSPAAGLRNLLN